MMHTFRAVLSKLLAVAIAAMLALGAYTWVAEPLFSRLADAKQRIEEQRTLLGRLTAAPVLRQVRDGMGSIRAGDAHSERVFLAGESDSIRSAGLQSLVSEKASAAGIRLDSALAVPKKSDGAVDLLGVEVQFQAALPQLQRILFDLESEHSYLLVESLRVSRAPDAPVRNGRDLDVRIVVLGATPRAETR